MGAFDDIDRAIATERGVPPAAVRADPMTERYGPAPPGPEPERTWWDTAKSAGQTADDFVRAAANAVSFGMADRLAGLTSEGGTDAQVKLSEEARKRSPITSIAGDVVGGVAIPGIGGARVAHALGNTARARIAGYGGEGAIVGALQGAGNTYTGNPEDYAKNAATGGAIGGAIGGTFGGLFGPRNSGPRSTAEVPTTGQLHAEKTANYDDLTRSGARYEPAAVSRAAGDAETTLRGPPYLFEPDTAPIAFRGIRHMHDPPTTAHLGRGAPVSPGDLDAIHKGINYNVVPGSPDMVAGGVVKRAINDFILNPPPGAVLPGTETAAREATALANRARGNYGGYRRSEMFDDLWENAVRGTAGQHSGLNLQNTLRQGVSGALRTTKGQSRASKAHYNADEIAELERFAHVPAGDAALRYVANLAGGGGGLGAMVAGGIGGGYLGQQVKDSPVAGTVLGAGVPAAGLALRIIGNRRANANMQELSEMVRRRTPLYQERAANAPMVQPGKSGSQMLRDAITTGLVKNVFGTQEDAEDDPLRITVNPRR